MRRHFLFAICVIAMMLIVESCKEYDDEITLPTLIHIGLESEEVVIKLQDTITIAPKFKSESGYKIEWTENEKIIGTSDSLVYIAKTVGRHKVNFRLENDGGHISQNYTIDVKLPAPKITDIGVEKAEFNLKLGTSKVIKPLFTPSTDYKCSWLLGEKIVSEEDSLTFQADKIGHYEIKFSVTNSSGSASQRYEIDVKEDIIKPRLLESGMVNNQVEILVGKTLSVIPKFESKYDYEICWKLDDKEISTKDALSYVIPSSLSEGVHKLSFTLIDRAGKITQDYSINVIHLPVITGLEDTYNIALGDDNSQLLEATVDDKGLNCIYEWQRDGNVIGTGKAISFHSQTEQEYTVKFIVKTDYGNVEKEIKLIFKQPVKPSFSFGDEKIPEHELMDPKGYGTDLPFRFAIDIDNEDELDDVNIEWFVDGVQNSEFKDKFINVIFNTPGEHKVKVRVTNRGQYREMTRTMDVLEINSYSEKAGLILYRGKDSSSLTWIKEDRKKKRFYRRSNITHNPQNGGLPAGAFSLTEHGNKLYVVSSQEITVLNKPDLSIDKRITSPDGTYALKHFLTFDGVTGFVKSKNGIHVVDISGSSIERNAISGTECRETINDIQYNNVKMIKSGGKIFATKNDIIMIIDPIKKAVISEGKIYWGSHGRYISGITRENDDSIWLAFTKGDADGNYATLINVNSALEEISSVSIDRQYTLCGDERKMNFVSCNLLYANGSLVFRGSEKTALKWVIGEKTGGIAAHKTLKDFSSSPWNMTSSAMPAVHPETGEIYLPHLSRYISTFSDQGDFEWYADKSSDNKAAGIYFIGF
ncbi:hypothetical protein FUAX_41940 (plasmid) [Fulvitalea axinellae]|uniref:Uncharacterized protein n=1 Tax=Fulvitalea axinellae TaxID=1182444 RepID=A0AAU9CXN6_9BACT|nr:hypothetical protein FUAX_41940 [Fulvitalea axinellae]